MKNILYLLLFTITFISCGDDPDPIVETPFDNWNDTKSPHYTDGKYNPVVGEWQLIQRNGTDATDFMVYKFDSSFTLRDSKTEPAEDKEPTYSNPKIYIINDKEYKIANTVYSYVIAGTLENARLTIKDGNTTLTFKPYVSKVWVWKGDWNSSSDPHYAIYNGKYNPIKGTWKLTHVGSDAISYTKYYRFNDDFTLEESYSPNTGFYDKHKYWINDTGVKEDAYFVHPSYTQKYKVEGNTLYYKTMLPPPPGSGLTFVRYY